MAIAHARGRPVQDSLAPAGLHYVNDDDPGITRHRRGRGFSYRDANGHPVTDPATLKRIRALAIPPAWNDVWICPSPAGHIQATGRDARRRKQYRYHAIWREIRDRDKFDRLLAFGESLPRLRRRVARDLARRRLDRDKVVAAVVRLLDATLLRVGNEEYARENGSFGLTTLRNRHGRVRGASVRFSFRGKGGKRHEVALRDPRLARVVRRCQDLPGQRLFGYLDEDDRPQAVSSDDVNAYIREAAGGDFSARDFRTWAASVLALRALRADRGDASRSNAILRAVKEVARWLGNTPAVCRSSYIHPAVLDEYSSDGIVGASTNGGAGAVAPAAVRYGLGADEQELLALLHRLETRRAAA